MQTVAVDLYEKVGAVATENRRLKAKLNRIWIAAIAGQADAADNGAAAWRDALRDIETLSR